MVTSTISVIIPTYRYDNFPNLQAAVWSLKAQTPVVPEIVVVVGGDIHLYTQAKLLPADTVLLDPLNHGACRARNMGAGAAHGEVVAFLDDDEVADPSWCAELMKVYDAVPAAGVGGKNLPLWECEPPDHLPEEMWWLVGATHKGFAPDNGVNVVRNTFAGNISFKRDLFLRIGGFREDIGFSNGKQIQGEEPEVCDRACAASGLLFWYNPLAIIRNRVPDDKARMWVLVRRAFWQGYTKRMLEQNGHSLKTEGDYLSTVRSGITGRLFHPSGQNLVEAVSLGLLAGAVGAGYVAKVIR